MHTSLAAAFFPFLLLLAWLGLLLYAVILATRLVKAVEQIARAVSQRPPDAPFRQTTPHS